MKFLLKLLGAKGLAVLVVLLISAVGVWGVRRHLALQAAYRALSDKLRQEHGLVATEKSRASELSKANQKLAQDLKTARRGTVIETHGTVLLEEAVRAGERHDSATGYTWQDHHHRFLFTDPDLNKKGDEHLDVNQKFRISATTVRLPDRTWATKAELYELSPLSGETLHALPFQLESSRVFEVGKDRGGFWSRFSPYVGVGIDQDLEPSFNLSYGFSLSRIFRRRGASVSSPLSQPSRTGPALRQDHSYSVSSTQ